MGFAGGAKDLIRKTLAFPALRGFWSCAKCAQGSAFGTALGMCHLGTLSWRRFFIAPLGRIPLSQSRLFRAVPAISGRSFCWLLTPQWVSPGATLEAYLVAR
jgi:hypothetical protein